MIARRKLIVPLLLVLVMIGQITGASAQTLPWREPLEPVRETAVITVGDDELVVELSVTGRQQSLGLGYRNGLEEGRGMLFVNESPSVRNFWMMGMRFCIDIVWIEDGEITGAAESVCPDPEGTDAADRARFSSGQPVTYVLEVPAGWLEANGYGRGTPVEIPEYVQELPAS